MDRILAAVLLITRNISREIVTYQTKEKFKGVLPGVTLMIPYKRAKNRRITPV